MKKIGLTGSIGSGKTTVSRVFSSLGVDVYYADLEARKFLEYKEIKDILIERYQKDIIREENEIDRKKLADIVFSDHKELFFLNSIIHPLVKSDFENWIKRFSDKAYVIHEAAILYESGFNESFDSVISVSAPEVMRIARVVQRDGLRREDVLRRMNNQWSDEQKAALSDYVIVNDEQVPVIPQVLTIHNQLLGDINQ